MSSNSSTRSLSSSKPYREEHLQDEQVQKFKKEFEEWQEFKSSEFSGNPGLNNEKTAGDMSNCLSQKKAIEREVYCSLNQLKIIQKQLLSFPEVGSFSQQLLSEAYDDRSFEQPSNAKFQEKMITPHLPARIVILKPSSDIKDEMKEPCGSSPELKLAEKDGSVEDLLKEVKERLRFEVEGKGRNDLITTSSPHESSMNLKWQLPEATGAMLGRSESMRSSRNPFHFDEQDSSESIKKETRKYIFDRLKTVLIDKDEGKSVGLWDVNKAVNESLLKVKRVPPSTLIRSFSAFASFGIPLAEDRSEKIEDQRFWKYGLSKNESSCVKKNKKDGFSIKSTVSNLRRNLGLKGKLFGKKATLISDSSLDTVHYMKFSEMRPSFARNFGTMQDNLTGLPPSPASYSCSPIRENHSPVSPLEAPFSEDQTSAQVSGELSMILQELERPAEHPESKSCLITTETQFYNSNETILIEDCGETFIRDILTVSGLYRPACLPIDHAISMLDGLTKPIPSWIFDEAGDNHRKLWNANDYYDSKVSLGDIDIDRKVLFDLVNEALPVVLNSKKATLSLAQLPHGRKLLVELSNQIKIYVNIKYDDKPESILKMMPWSTVSIEDLCFIGRAVEWLIMSEVIDDLLFDLLL